MVTSNRLRQMVMAVAMASLMGASGCGSQRLRTGEPALFGVQPKTGQLIDRDLIPDAEGTTVGVVPHQGEIITVIVNSMFIKKLDHLFGDHVLVYAEVYDDGSDDSATAVKKVIFNDDGTPAGVHLAFADRVLYGPCAYKGFPLRIKLYAVELAKGQKTLASQLLNAAGSIAQTSQPQAAPAVGVVLQIAQFLNQLTQDDFELRCDVTLYPVGSKATVFVPKELTDNDNGLAQRSGKATTLVTQLRTGQYAIIKRELNRSYKTLFGKKASDQKDEKTIDNSTLEHDWAQRYHLGTYHEGPTTGATLTVGESLAVEGGRLWYSVEKMTEQTTAGPATPTTQPTIVVPQSGPNAGLPYSEEIGQRRPFNETTYLTFSVLNDLPSKLTDDQLRAGSDRDSKVIANLLDNPNNLSLADRLGKNIDAVASSVKTLIQQRQIATNAAKKNGQDPGFRKSTDYPAYWAGQINPLGSLAEGTTDRSNAVALNSAILPVLNDIVTNFPLMDPNNSAEMAAVQALNSSSFVAFDDAGPATTTTTTAPTTAPSKSKHPGLFKLTKDALDNLGASKKAAPPITGSANASSTNTGSADTGPNPPAATSQPSTRQATSQPSSH